MALASLGTTFAAPATETGPRWPHVQVDSSLARAAGADKAIVVLAQIRFDSAALAEKAAMHARQLASKTRMEDGCLHYAFGLDVNDSAQLVLSEWWRDGAALHSHLLTPHLRDFRLALREIGRSRSSVRRYVVDSISDLVLPPLNPG